MSNARSNHAVSLGTISGFKVYTDPLMVETTIDWSGVRSKSRAKRRIRYGHKQNTKTIIKPMEKIIFLDDNKIVMHPSILAKMEEQLGKEVPTYGFFPYFPLTFRKPNNIILSNI